MLTKKRSGVLLLLLTIIVSVFAQVHFITDLYAIEEPVISDSPSTTNFNLRKIGQYIGGHEIVDVEVENNIAYLADQIEGLLVVNISNIDLPILLDTYQAEDESIYDITLQDGYAYLAHGRAGFRIIDITNPSNVVEVGGYNNGGIAWKVFITNNYAYVADRLQGIEIIDITNKANPTKIGVYDGQPYDVFVREDYAYVAAGLNKGLEIVDISNPASPKKVGETEVNFEDTVGVFVEGDYAFVANKENGIKIIKIKYARNPKIITEFTNITEGSRVWAIYVEDSFAYLACENKGIQILDVTEITNPYKIGEFSDESGKAFGLAVEDNLIYLATICYRYLSWK
ncbi:MAG: LVIVD repeat-containing protein [Candidatus Heimdallarchaeota archaeon]